VLKTVGQVAFAGRESGASFVNNYVFERKKDGSAPTAGEVLSRLGRLGSLMVVPVAPGVYYQNRNDMNRAFEYTELGLASKQLEGSRQRILLANGFADGTIHVCVWS
jgi:hypothetical protein